VVVAQNRPGRRQIAAGRGRLFHTRVQAERHVGAAEGRGPPVQGAPEPERTPVATSRHQVLT